MKKMFIAGLFIAASFSVNAQISLKKTATAAQAEATGQTGLNASSILTTLANGIQPSSFSPGWASAKSGWLSAAEKVVSLADAGGLLGKLVGLIKPSAFNAGFESKLPSIMQSAKTVSSLGSLGSIVSSVVGGLKTSSLTSDFAKNKDTFVSALSLLK